MNKYLTFILGGQPYGVSISSVISIEKIAEITAMPEQPNYVKGNINYSGIIVPIIDLNLRLGKAETELTEYSSILVVNIDGADVGFIIDATGELIDIDDDKISPPPSLSSDIGNRVIEGVSLVANNVVFLLNIETLISKI